MDHVVLLLDIHSEERAADEHDGRRNKPARLYRHDR